jgi:flagellin FlaB
MARSVNFAQPLASLRARLRDERGITGLETAIILIAFVVVAAVFSFVVLSTGLFSSERGRETVYAGLAKTRGTIALNGGIIATSDGTELTDLLMTVSLAAGGDAVSFDGAATTNRTVISYNDNGVAVGDLTYVATPLAGDGDMVLEAGELFEIGIDLTQNAAIEVTANETFWLEVKPPSGSYQVVQRTTPGSVSDTVIDLN